MLQVLRRMASRQQRSLAAAFVGEIAAILRSMDEHAAWQNPNDGEQTPERANGSRARRNISALPRFTIYEANAQNIANFDGRTARELAYFYTCAATLSERLRSLPLHIEPDDRERCMQLLHSDAECVLDAGDQILRRLRPLVSRQSPASITRA